jgi:hypothetical protein
MNISTANNNIIKININPNNFIKQLQYKNTKSAKSNKNQDILVLKIICYNCDKIDHYTSNYSDKSK